MSSSRSVASPSAPSRARQQRTADPFDTQEWESDDGGMDSEAALADSTSEKSTVKLRQRKVRQHVVRGPTTPRKAAAGTVRSPVKSSASGLASPIQAKASTSTTSLRQTRTPIHRDEDADPPPPLRRRVPNTPTSPSFLAQCFSVAYSALTTTINLTHTILHPFYPYIFLTFLAGCLLSYATYYLTNAIPPFLFYLPGRLFRLVTPSRLISPGKSDIALGRSLALTPFRLIATPACALTGQLCAAAYANATLSGKWWTRRREPEVNVAEVARRMAKEAQGARDIFESIATLSEGGMVGRLEYVRVWELSAAIQVGSNLEAKDMVSKGLGELGNLARDLSDELVETNALAIDGFTWLQWEFADLVRILSLPRSQKPTALQLSTRLNAILTRLSSTLSSLHTHASHAHALASRGSISGLSLRTELNTIGHALRKSHEREPGWRPLADRAKHLVVGGEQTKAELVARDLRLAESTISEISTLVRDLEETRLGIKGFRDQIAYFDASMMGFHLGAGEHVGVGVEEEVSVLARVVGEFERAVSRGKQGGVGGGGEGGARARGIEGR